MGIIRKLKMSAAYGEPLLEEFNSHRFATETQCQAPAYARQVAAIFVGESLAVHLCISHRLNAGTGSLDHPLLGSR